MSDQTPPTPKEVDAILANNPPGEIIEYQWHRTMPRKPSEIIFGSHPVSDLILGAATTEQLQRFRARIVDQALAQAEARGKDLRSIRYYPVERDRSVYDPLDQRWILRWEAVLE